MRTLAEYIDTMRQLQPRFDSEETLRKVSEASKVRMEYLRPHSEVPLHPTDDNQIITLDLNIDSAIELLRQSGVEFYGTKEKTRMFGPENVTYHLFRNPDGAVYSDFGRGEFQYLEPSKIVTPIGFEISAPSVKLRIPNFIRELIQHDGELDIQTTIQMNPRGIVPPRVVEDQVLGILEKIRDARIICFYGRLKSGIGVINI